MIECVTHSESYIGGTMTRIADNFKKILHLPARKPHNRRRINKAGLPPHLEQLAEMLTYKRPAYSVEEEQFTKRFIDSIPGMQMDAVGNRYLRVGTAPVMFSAHTDTVHAKAGRQKVYYDPHLNQLFKADHDCLGADDGVGVWIMLNLIEAGVEGLYVFHQAEEIGGVGSAYIADETPELVKGMRFCIAFDRRGNSDIITHQAGGRCCSDEFAQDLGIMLGHGYKACDGGVFTDSANYTHLIPECTNLSVGYYNEHSRNEYVDLGEAETLLTALLALDWAQLETYRDPKAATLHDMADADEIAPAARYDDIIEFVMNNPVAASDLLYDLGCTYEDIEYARQDYRERMS